ncbi:hypothetical protein Bca101_059781 [Brassica carinata]
MPPSLFCKLPSTLSDWVYLASSSSLAFSVFGTPETSRSKVNSWESLSFFLPSRKHVATDRMLYKGQRNCEIGRKAFCDPWIYACRNVATTVNPKILEVTTEDSLCRVSMATMLDV